MRQSSRDPRDLHPELARRWRLARQAWLEKYPDLPDYTWQMARAGRAPVFTALA